MSDVIPQEQNSDDSDESLNAGAVLPDAPIGDVLTNEIEADPSVIMEMIPKLEEGQVTTESNYNALSYLRDDLIASRGMTQSIAAEAIAIIPNFGRKKPVTFYSKHPSNTGWTAALEEIDENMASDVIGQLKMLVNRIDNMTGSVAGKTSALETVTIAPPGKLSMLYYMFRDFTRLADSANFPWDDATFQACLVDKTQVSLTAVSSIPKKIPSSFVAMDEYYCAHLEAPAMLEMMDLVVREWTEAYREYLAALHTGAPAKVNPVLPKTPSVSFANGKVTTIDNVGDIFKAAADKRADASESWKTIDWAQKAGNAEEQMVLNVIVDRLTSYDDTLTEMKTVLLAAVECLESYSASDDDLTFVTDGIYKLTTAFVRSQQAQHQAYQQILLWCLSASLASSYVAALVSGVTEMAWKSINQQKDTLQMPEETYANLEATMKQIVETAATVK